MQRFRTSNMECTIKALDAKYDRVMVRAVHLLANPIRLRRKMLQDIRPFEARNDPAWDGEITKWLEENGTLINYRTFRNEESRTPHDAQFVCECPFSMNILDDMARDVGKLLVVYQPSTWRAHDEMSRILHPSGISCKKFVQAILAVKQEKDMARMAQAAGIPTAGTRAATNESLQDALRVIPREMKNIRKLAMRSYEGRRFSTIIPLIPRIEPEDKNLMQLYEFIKNDLPSDGHVKLARDNVLSKAMRFWKIGLKALVRSGSVERKEEIGFYYMNGLKPDYERINAEHAVARSMLNRMAEKIDALPEFRVPAAKSQSSSGESREYVARSHGKPD